MKESGEHFSVCVLLRHDRFGSFTSDRHYNGLAACPQ